MSAVAHHDSLVAVPDRREVLLNFCRVVLRSDETHLQLAIEEYRRSLMDSLSHGSRPQRAIPHA